MGIPCPRPGAAMRPAAEGERRDLVRRGVTAMRFARFTRPAGRDGAHRPDTQSVRGISGMIDRVFGFNDAHARRAAASAGGSAGGMPLTGEFAVGGDASGCGIGAERPSACCVMRALHQASAAPPVFSRRSRSELRTRSSEPARAARPQSGGAVGRVSSCLSDAPRGSYRRLRTGTSRRPAAARAAAGLRAALSNAF